jgi:hypothetical protein
MKIIISTVVFLFFFGGVSLFNFNPEIEEAGFGQFLPDEINGWNVEDDDRTYDPETIFDYIDGAGEVYRSYNFRTLYVRRYVKEGEPDIVADCFDMGTSEDAFGVFTHDLEGEEVGIGQGSAYNAGLLSFWKSHYFVSLYAEEETEKAKEAVLALGQKIAASIGEEGEKPDLISLLPGENLVEKSVHYFHNHTILNYHFFVADENILLLDQKTEVVLGTYERDDDRIRLLLIRYPETNEAAGAYKSFTKNYMPDAESPGLVQTENTLWTAAKVKERFLMIAFDCPTDLSARTLVQDVERKIEQLK